MTSSIPLPRRGDRQQHLLDALPDATAIVDRYGVIRAVNRAWTLFGANNAGAPAITGVGVNYLQVCDHAAAAGITAGVAAAADLRAVLAGESTQRDVEYDCSSPSTSLWCVVRMTPITGLIPGALISHLNITARISAEQQLRHDAYHDSLTGLANRTLLLERLTEALTPRPGRAQTPDVGLLLLDLDKFKAVNDTYGHAVGDEVLRVIAHRLQGAVQAEDTVARLGGDEFVVLTPRTTAPALTAMARKITCVLTPPLLIHGHSLQVTASIGTHLALLGSAASDILAAADTAMYGNKATIDLPHMIGAMVSSNRFPAPLAFADADRLRR